VIDLPPERWTLVELVRRQAQRFGERRFLWTRDRQELTFAGLDRRSDAIAGGLRELGVGPGDRVLAFLSNRPEFLELLVGANKCGAIFVPLNTELKGSFLEHQLRNSAPRVVVIDADLLPAFGTVPEDDYGVETTVLLGSPGGPVPPLLQPTKRLSFPELLGSGGASAGFEPTPRDISTVMYTSGTTGPSKGVLMPHAHVVLMAIGLARTMRLSPDDLYYVCMPLFHANGLFLQVVGSLVAGARVVLVPRFSASAWLDDIRQTGATVTNGLGVMPEFLYRRPPTPHDRDHRLRAMMAVPIAPEWGGAFAERFGVRIVQGYGMTECNIVAYTDLDDALEPGCCGRILEDWFEVKVVDPDSDVERPCGEVGEIVVRPKVPWAFMQGYLRMPEKTVEAWRNLWFHTGDAGRFDSRGRLWFVDRIKDCIRRRGENISSFEVEQVLNSHPAILESAVVAVPSPIPGGEDEVKACVVLRPGERLEISELLEYCRPRMPRFAIPEHVEFLDSLPKTPTGKIQKQLLKGVRPPSTTGADRRPA
jgi:crotonobetaine/carnitine-CoA ligase